MNNMTVNKQQWLNRLKNMQYTLVVRMDQKQKIAYIYITLRVKTGGVITLHVNNKDYDGAIKIIILSDLQQ